MAAVLLSSQGAALGAWGLCVPCPAAGTISQPWQSKSPSTGHVKGTPESQGSFSIPKLSLQCLAPLSQPDTVSQLPEQMFVPTTVCACKSNSSADNSTWMRADFHIYVFQTAHSLPFLCVYPLAFLLTGCGLPSAARAQTEINKATSVFELPSKIPRIIALAFLSAVATVKLGFILQGL